MAEPVAARWGTASTTFTTSTAPRPVAARVWDAWTYRGLFANLVRRELRVLQERGTTIQLVTHAPDQVLRLSTKAAVFDHSLICEGDPVRQVRACIRLTSHDGVQMLYASSREDAEERS